MFKVLKTINRKYVTYLIAGFYKDDHFDSVLKFVPMPYSGIYIETVYQNVFRILALKKNSDDKWLHEYGYLISEKMLEKLRKEDREYLQVFLLYNIMDEVHIDPRPQINTDKISAKVLKYFPMNLEDDSVKRFFH